MTRDATLGSWFRDALGIVVTIVAALLLAFVLLRIVNLGREAGLDRTALTRERVAASETKRILAAIERLDDYREALLLRSSDLTARRTAVDGALQVLEDDLIAGDAAMFRLDAEANGIAKAWASVRKLAPGTAAATKTGTIIERVGALLSTLEDRSGLTYDPSVTAQELADTYMQATIIAIAGTRHLDAVAHVALKNNGLTLRQRLNAASNVNNLEAAVDLTRDELPTVVTHMQELAPQSSADWAKLPQLARRLNDTGTAYARFMMNEVVLKDKPTISIAQVHARGAGVIASATDLNLLAARALDTSLAARGRLEIERSRYLYLAFVLGALLIVGVMLSIAQFVARRDRKALGEALRESARLQAELARQQAEEALRLSEAQFRAVFDGAAIAIAVVDRGGSVIDSNDVFRTIFGDSIRTALDGHEMELESLWRGERETFEYEQHARFGATQEIWTDATVSIVNDESGEARFAICMFRDKTELKHTERRIAHGATHDALTGLPNRQLFEEQLQRRFEESGALLDSFFAVLFVDLEHFAEINESLGHASGDLALVQVATRLRSSVDARDVVARLGGDEFAILIRSLGDIIHVESVARRLINNLSKQIVLGDRAVFLTASIGIAVGSPSYTHAEDVLRDAEIAMQQAKAGGGARYALFDSTMHDRAQKRLQLISDLRVAADRREFRLLYQPIVALDDGRITGAEALIRWDHPNLGLLYPSEFVPLAEQTRMTQALGRFVVDTVCEQVAVWRRNRGGTLAFDMHVNISAAELSDPDFERKLVQVVEHQGLDPGDFTIEITESVMLDAGTRANQTLRRVRERGFKICIDDFGTGYSSLRYLQQFEVDCIKIDRSFVAGEDGRLASEPIVRTMLTLAEAYNVRVVAEGVETAQQREMLRNAGCRFGQGYLFAMPLAPSELTRDYPDVLGRVTRPA